ncbi:MlaD family protein [Nocardia sp. NBC_01009]|uniref:MlaD family protein n=1 Tax=Nocardia sp. NBC_01009 TaxID=2975996 RepID=UPI00386D3423|nr:MlaD family protein [Nocardia sp. NBC_01009]
MQELTIRLPGRRGRDRHEATKNRRELRLGVIGAILIVIALAATAVLSVLPLGKRTYTAYLSEAQSIRVGNQIRVAGISVGTVSSLELQPDRVRMTFTVDRDVFVGDATTLEIRMLTVVGGHYVAMIPAGTTPLGSKSIPPERVTLPYSLVRTLQDAAKPVAEVNGSTLRENLAAVQTSLDRSPDGLRRMGAAMQSFVTILAKQNAEVSRALIVTDEFLTAINGNRSLVGQFVRKIGLLEVQGLDKKAEITEALRIAAELLSRIAALEPSWREQLQPMVDKLSATLPALRELVGKLDGALGTLRTAHDRLQTAVTPQDGIVVDQSADTISAPAVCVPVPGKGC